MADQPKSGKDKTRRLYTRALGAVALTVLGFILVMTVRNWVTARELVRMDPDLIPAQARLVSFSQEIAKPAYAAHCASCHGADMKGDRAKGAPNLSDAIWLYEAGRVSEVERTILYGIRSGSGKARNVTDMPGMGADQQITHQDARDAHAYVKMLAGDKTQNAEVVARGEHVFQNKGLCYDCHAADAQGNPDYGAPNLIDSDTLYGNDDATFEHSAYFGRHGVCPARIGVLSFTEIRALAVYLSETARPRASKDAIK